MFSFTKLRHLLYFSTQTIRLCREDSQSIRQRKIQIFISQQRRTLAEVEYLDLNSATKIAEDLQTHKLFWEKSKTDDDDDNDESTRTMTITMTANL